MDITPAMYKDFQDNQWPKASNLREELGDLYSPNLYLKKYLREQLADMLNDFREERKKHFPEECES